MTIMRIARVLLTLTCMTTLSSLTSSSSLSMAFQLNHPTSTSITARTTSAAAHTAHTMRNLGTANLITTRPPIQATLSSNTALHMSSSNDDDNDDDSEIYVMVNGMPGPMATAAAEACLRKGLKLTPVAMTGPDVQPMSINVYDPVSGKSSDVRLIPSTQQDELVAAIAGSKSAFGDKNVIAIDYTHPSAVNSNAEFYVQQQLPFVMGTTGGDRDKLLDDVNSANHFAVIAPNMAKQIVAMQAALEDLATKFPGCFQSYTLACRESHQSTKADTSGTAKAVIDSMNVLKDGVSTNDNSEFTYDNIEMIRDDAGAIDFGVPEDALKGHAFHRYTLTSSDGTTQFALEHNVAGRAIYAEGTADAVKFLAGQLQSPNAEGKVYSMIDVLKAGALE